MPRWDLYDLVFYIYIVHVSVCGVYMMLILNTTRLPGHMIYVICLICTCSTGDIYINYRGDLYHIRQEGSAWSRYFIQVSCRWDLHDLDHPYMFRQVRSADLRYLHIAS